ncbi:hypothetical protein CPB86DRAFT_789318 [Serendipita vermifera]|nr:hypothetical protein CPB86DRAFT_789318 [Serendipita vermifera]
MLARSTLPQEENWDDDFEFANSPRNSPVPAAAPIHTFVHNTRSHTRLRSNSNTQGNNNNGVKAATSNAHLRAGSSNTRIVTRQPSGSAPVPQPQPSQAKLGQPTTSQGNTLTVQGHARGRYSGASTGSEDWDVDDADVTVRKEQPLRPSINIPAADTHHSPSTYHQPEHARMSTDQSSAVIMTINTNLDPNHTRQQSHSPTPSGGNISPTMSAFSIPLSIDSSMHHHHPSVHSRGGSSTNFLLHTGRRSVLEIEKGRQQQERERRKLRKKNRPSNGATNLGDDDYFDVYGRSAGAAVPRRYAAPLQRRDGDDNSSIDLDDDDEEGSSSSDEEEQPPRKRPALASIPSGMQISSRSGAGSSLSPAIPLTGSINTSRSNANLQSTSKGSSRTDRPVDTTKSHPLPPPVSTGPSKLTRRTSNSNVLSKPPPHNLHPSSSKPSMHPSTTTTTTNTKHLPTGSSKQPGTPASTKSKPLPPSAAPPVPTTTATAHSPATSPLRHPMSLDPSLSPESFVKAAHQHGHNHHIDDFSPRKKGDDCGSSIGASSHKQRQPGLLGRLGSLKKWGKSSPRLLGSTLALTSHNEEKMAFPTHGNPSTTALAVPPSASTTALSDHGRKSPHGASKLGTRSTSNASSSGAGSVRGKGLFRKPSGLFKSSHPDSADSHDASHESNDGKATKKDEGRRGLNPFRRISITGPKRTGEQPASRPTSPLGDNKQHTRPTSPPTTKPEAATHKHSRTISFTSRIRSKSGSAAATSGDKEDADAKDTTDSKHSAAGMNKAGAHTLGRSAAMEKASKLGLKLGMSSGKSEGETKVSKPTDEAKTKSKSSLTAPFTSTNSSRSTHSNVTVNATQKGGDKSDVDSLGALAPGSKSRHEREQTVKPTLPLPSSKAPGQSESTPRARDNVKPLPSGDGHTGSTAYNSSGAATMGRVSGSQVNRERQEPVGRRSSAGEANRPGGSMSRRGGELKIPARISMKQGSLKRELEAVKEFATSVEDLKRLQASYQSIMRNLPAMTGTMHRSTLAAFQQVDAQYNMWWECADLLVELGGAAPPTVAGTPILENYPASSAYPGTPGRPYMGPTNPLSTAPSISSHHTTGTQRSFSSSSSTGDLTSRQLHLLQQMLSTPNPSQFSDPATSSRANSSRVTLSSDISNQSNTDVSSHQYHSINKGSSRGMKEALANPKWSKDRPSHEISGSGSDHMLSDLTTSSVRGKKSSIESGDLGHDPVPPNYPYSQGTWKSKQRASTSASGSRPSLAGTFAMDRPGPKAAKHDSTSKNQSRGTLAYESSSSAAGIITTDDAGDVGSDWDAESGSDQARNVNKLASIGRSQGSSYHTRAPSTSTTSSSIDMTFPTRLALTPENIVPLLVYAKEVKTRLNDCLEELRRLEKTRSTRSHTHTHEYTSGRTREAEVGVSTRKRA